MWGESLAKLFVRVVGALDSPSVIEVATLIFARVLCLDFFGSSVWREALCYEVC
ncbi:hypothetical protein EMIT0P12_100032 [Pseudomonas sp. IT-P12]